MKEIISTERAPAAIGPYSQAVKAGSLVFVSGQIPLETDGTLKAQGIAEQTRRVLENLKAVLEAAGLTLADVLKTTVFLANLSDFNAMNAVYAEFFGSSRPARATVEVAGLPRDVLIEVDCVACA